MMNRTGLVMAATFMALLGSCGKADHSSDRLVIRAAALTLRVDVARTTDAQHRGLMRRASLAPDAGMLFVLKEPGRPCFWMKNTTLALSIAFIDAAGQVLNLADMTPGSVRKHCAAGQAAYALEVNRGLLVMAGVRPGTFISGLPQGR
jgi:uncharacterized membrane protein (UPF0127 family)